MTEQTQIQVVNLTINGQAVTVPKGTTVYTAAKQLGFDIPIFCYQDRMPPFGACRMCLVEVEKMPKLQASCTLEATEGMVVNTQSSQAVKGREEILEFLLINHPLDCPICDRGGECPLQDQTIKFGPGESRFYEEKRHFKKPLPLGPVLMLDRERCITCARCTRFGEIIAGDHALEFIDRGYRTEVGTPGGAPAKSKFIGNTIMICPVGALTSQVYRFRARPWDNESAESTCTLCPVGCSLVLDSRDGEIVRTRSRENRAVNDIWLCDKGWFGYEFSSHPDRLTKPLIRREGKLEPAEWEEAISLIASKMKEAQPKGKLAAWGGNPLTVEENYLLQQLMRQGMGVNHVDHRVGMPLFSLDEEGLPPGMEMPIEECEKLSYALLLGVDLTEEFPVIWLRLKQAIDRGAKVYFYGHFAPEIAPHLTETILHAPGKELESIQQISHLLSGKENKGAIFVGRQYLASPQRKKILAELLKITKSIPDLSLNLLEGNENSTGARFAGMHPELGPCSERLEQPGFNALQVLEYAAKERWDFLYVAGANPAAQYPAQLWKEARKNLGFFVVQDLFLHQTAQQADVVLPTLSFVEKRGTFINIEGRIQKLHPGKDLLEGVYSDAAIFRLLGGQLNILDGIDSRFSKTLETERVSFSRPDSIEVSVKSAPLDTEGKLTATFSSELFDRGVRMKRNTHLVQLAKHPRVRMHPSEGIKRGIQDNDRIALHVQGNKLSAKVHLDETVAESTLVLPLGFNHLPVHELSANPLNGFVIDIQKEV